MPIIVILNPYMNKSDVIRTRYAEVFSIYEKEVVEECISLGHFNHVIPSLETKGLTVFTPEKEQVLGDYIELRRPVTLDADSPTRQELEKMAQEGEKIETPEQEAAFQAKLDAEKAEKEAALKARMDAKEGESEEMVEDPRLSFKKPELVTALTEKGIDFKVTQSKSELLALLLATDAPAPVEEVDPEAEDTEDEE